MKLSSETALRSRAPPGCKLLEHRLERRLALDHPLAPRAEQGRLAGAAHGDDRHHPVRAACPSLVELGEFGVATDNAVAPLDR